MEPPIFVREQCHLHRTALEVVRNEYAAESCIEIAANGQMEFAVQAAVATATRLQPAT